MRFAYGTPGAAAYVAGLDRIGPTMISSPPRTLFAIAVTCSALTGGGCSAPNAAPPVAYQATVQEVVDGDTIKVILADPPGTEETVRLLGIDTPEKPGGPRPAECGGEAATDFTRTILPEGTSVELARDQETRDVYGRLLAWVVRVDDGAIVNLEILAQGHGTVLYIAPNAALRAQAESAADEARRASRGFWSQCGGLPFPLADDR